MPAPRLLIKRVLVITVASVVILAGLLVGGVRLIDELMPEYRQAMAARIGERIDAQVDIAAIELRWQWRGPLLALDDVRITRRGADKPAATMDGLGLHFAFADLVDGRRLPDGLLLDSPRLALRRGENGRPTLVHWSREGDEPIGWPAINELLDRLARVEVSNATITLLDSQLPGGEATLTGVDTQLQRAGGGRSWQLSAGGPDWLGRLEGSGRFQGPLPAPEDATFDITLGPLDGLALARAVQRFDGTLLERLNGGEVSLRLRGAWRDHRLAEATARIETTALEDRDAAPVLPPLSATLQAAHGDDNATGTPADIRFVVSALTGDIDGLERFALTGALDIDEPMVRIDARHLPVALGLRLARLHFDALANTDIDARVDNFTLTAGADTPLQFGFDFDALAIERDDLVAGPVSGSYYRKGDSHVLQFEGADGRLAVERYLRGELAIDNLGGEVTWRRDAGAWQIDARQLTLDSGEARLRASGRLRLPDEGTPVIDLRGEASAPDVARLLQRIPQAPDLPNERLRDWLPKAIGAGTLDNASLEIAGPLDRFPFAEPAEGERFHLELTGHDIDVDYQPGWPALNNARGRLTLDGDDLRVDVAQAEMLGVTLGPATGRVANVREPVLMLDGRARNAGAQKMLTFLTESPLRDRFAAIVDALDITGPADLALDLRIPLKPGLGDLDVNGRVEARGLRLRQQALPGPITGITGSVRFGDDGLRAEDLRGNLLGVALTADLLPGAGERQRIESRARLALPADRAALAHYLPDGWLDYARGEAGFDVVFDVTPDGEVSPITIRSDLAGMALALPAPFTKPPPERASLAIEVAPDGGHIDVGYDRRLNVDVRLRDGAPRRVQARLNAPALQPPDVDGVWIGGRADRVDGIGWFELVKTQLAAAEGADATPSTLAFTGGDLRIGRLDLGNRYFEDSHIRAQTMQAQPGWRIDFEGPDTQGQVTWTQPAGGNVTIAGNLRRLALKTREQPPQPPADTDPILWEDMDPLEFPHLDVYVANVQVDDTDFGQADIQARARADGWQLDRVRLSQGALNGWATGRWTRSDGLTSASAQTRFEGRGLSELLRTLGYASTVQAETARVHARLDIAANAAGLDLRELDGQVDLALDDGTLTSVEPGAGRVLGLFNLYVLPRRLSLDFRDVVDEGLAFDSVRANFNIENGNAYSDNMRIETPSSTIRIQGHIGLATRDYHERVTITPKVGSGVAIAGTVLGGPLVGIAAFAVQELLKKPIRKFSSIAYTLTGSWDDPRIEQPSAEE